MRVAVYSTVLNRAIPVIHPAYMSRKPEAPSQSGKMKSSMINFVKKERKKDDQFGKKGSAGKNGYRTDTYEMTK